MAISFLASFLIAAVVESILFGTHVSLLECTGL